MPPKLRLLALSAFIAFCLYIVLFTRHGANNDGTHPGQIGRVGRPKSNGEVKETPHGTHKGGTEVVKQPTAESMETGTSESATSAEGPVTQKEFYKESEALAS